MNDDLSKEQTMKPITDGLPPIQSFEDHLREIRRLWITCLSIGTVIFILSGGSVIAFALGGHSIAILLGVSTIIFQVVALTYGSCFVLPCFLTSLKKLHLSVRMMYESISMGREGTDAMKEIRDEAKPLFTDAKEIVTKLKPFSDKLTPELVDEFLGYMKDIRDRVVRDTEPLPVTRRPAAETVKSDGDGR